MPNYRDDFREIAHCGGKMIFRISRDPEGYVSIEAGWTNSRPVGRAVFGLYADLVSGAVIGDLPLVDVTVASAPQPPPNSLPILLGSDTGKCWGHQCPACNEYFRSTLPPGDFFISCTSCGLAESAKFFLTDAQQRYVFYIVREVSACIQRLSPDSQQEVIIDMDEAADRETSLPKLPFFYAEKAMQTEFRCIRCDGYNDVRGRFAYCNSCGWRNNRESMRVSFERLRERLNSQQLEPSAAVREAVSEFDACCRDFAKQVQNRIPMKAARRDALERAFHDIDGPAFSVMKELADIDLKRGIDGDMAFLRRMIQRRHVYEHHGGVADDTYVRESGDTDVRVGDLLRETLANAHRLIGILNRMIANLEADFHEIFLPLNDGISRKKG